MRQGKLGDGDDRLSGITHAFADSAADVAWSFRYDAGNGLLGRGATNDAYTSHGAARSQGYLANGLNQYASVTTTRYSYDGRGNLTSDGTRSFTYDVDNRLLTGSAPTAVTLAYDPTGRLQTSTASSATTTFLYDGANLAAEYSGSTVLRRYVPSGLGVDMPLVWYEGAAEATPRWLHADNQGSIVAYSDLSGDNDDIYGYDPWGLPDAANGWSGSRFRYTGQITIPQASLYYYKARVYDPNLGRFLQTDPVGYASDVNPYAYVHNDPIGGIDSFGLDDDNCDSPCVAPVTVTGQPIPTDPGDTFQVSAAVANLLNSNPEIDPVTVAELVVTARKAPQNTQKSCSILGNSVGSKAPWFPNGYYYTSYGLGVFAVMGGEVNWVAGFQVSNHVIVSNFSGFNFHAGLGLEGVAGISWNYSSSMPLVTSPARFSLEGGAGIAGGSASWAGSSAGNLGFNGFSGGLGIGKSAGLSIGADASGGQCLVH